MKKLFALICTAALLVLCMAVSASAAEYVYYENDFSDSATISDFTQYRGEWVVEDGVLKLKSAGGLGLDEQVFLLYTADDAVMNLTDYILEVDVTPNALAGVLARCDLGYAYAEAEDGYCGYQLALNFATNSGNSATTESLTLGRTNTAGVSAGPLGSSSFASKRNYTHHITMTVEGANVTVVVTDPEGVELWNYTAENGEWAMGTFGFSAVPADMSVSMVNIGVLSFDNLKVTAIGAVGDHLANGGALSEYVPSVQSNPIVIEKVNASEIDFSNTEYVLYENDFSDETTLEDFMTVGGEWVVQDGKLYLSSVDEGFVFSYIAYIGDETGYVGLASDYTAEVDLCDVMAGAGLLTYVDPTLCGNEFYGYMSFASNDATKAALGATDATGAYANIKVSGGVLTPGNDYHIVAEHFDGMITFTFTDIESGELVYEYSTTADKWSTGSFGLRMRANNGDSVNAMHAYFDNLKVTVKGEEAALINSGFAPNSEIIDDTVEEVVTTEAVETTAPAEETTAEVADTTEVQAPSEGGSSTTVIIIAAVAVVVILAVVVVIVKGKKK
ncbi:MAG: hypothetical protein IJ002_06620 [Clostridia bacterium]|nr:hypothetical protein [Clostridia bacterium]